MFDIVFLCDKLKYMVAKKQKIYLDTSVISAYLDERAPERQTYTKFSWKMFKHYEVYISQLVVKELQSHPNSIRRKELLQLIQNFKTLSIESKEIKNLAQKYIQKKIIPKNYWEDALHLACASVYGLNILVTWNYAHLLKLETRKKVNVVNALLGYKPIELVEPPML